MFKIVEPIGKLFSVKHFTTSDTIFLLNTKFTTALLVLFSILLTTMDLLRASIDCYTDSESKRKPIMDNYCWSIGTYICKDHHKDDILSCIDTVHEENKIHQRYYQWIPLLLLVQAVISYVPAYAWKVSECGLLHKLCDNLDVAFGRSDWNERKTDVINYFSDKFAGRAHMQYTIHYIVCKILTALLTGLNILVLYMVIPGFWSTFSSATVSLITGNISEWITNSDLVFPRTAKCQYKSYGPSGSAQTFDALCLLPLNVLNQKIFVIIWMWFICQLIASIGNLIYWLVIYCSQNLRIYILQQRSLMYVSRNQIMQATDKGHLGNYFVLNQMAKNTNTVTFVEILTELSMKNFNSGNLSTRTLNTASLDFIGEKSA